MTLEELKEIIAKATIGPWVVNKQMWGGQTCALKSPTKRVDSNIEVETSLEAWEKFKKGEY